MTAAPLTVGLEEEVLLLDPETHAPAPVAATAIARAADARIKPELPAAQVELMTHPHADVAGAIGELAELRQALVAAASGLAVPAAAAVHPTAAPEAAITAAERYSAIEAAYGPVARMQLVSSLQVHVAAGERTLDVYNGLREHLPQLAALAAAAPFYGGRDTGLASVRPLICTLLPRQGVPPAITSWEQHAAELAWNGSRQWWWELRPHPEFGTLELRVPDVQPTLERAAAIAETVRALVAWLVEQPACDPVATWRIEENRWSALRDGVDGELADLRSGERRPTRAVLADLLAQIEAPPVARALAERNTATDLRRIGVSAATGWLADAFLG